MIGNVEALGRSGVFVPETGTRGYKVVHHELAWEHNERVQGRSLFARLREELIYKGRPERIVISSEGFEFQIAKAAKRQSLVSFFTDLGYRLKVIAYIRPQDAYINSSYSQMTKFLIDLGTFDDYLKKALNQIRFDYSRHLLPLFRDPAIVADLRPFNSATLGIPIELDFLASLDLPAHEAALVRRVTPLNEAPGPMTIALCRAIMVCLAGNGRQLSKQQQNRTGRFIRELTDGFGWNTTKFNALAPETSTAIRRHFAESNEGFSREVWGREWAEVFEDELARQIIPHVYDPSSDSEEGQRQFTTATEKVLRWIAEENITPTTPRRFLFTGRVRKANSRAPV